MSNQNFIHNTHGANLVEYIILVGMVALIAFAGFKAYGKATTQKIEQQSSAVGGINGSTN